MKITNDVFKTSFKSYEHNFVSLYREESVCLLVFRILPPLCQQMIMRIIHVDGEINYQDLKCSDICDDYEKEFKLSFLILFETKIITSKINVELNEDFKRNLLKIISSGLTPLNFLFKKKKKDWCETFNYGIESLETYLKSLFELDKFPLISVENESLRFLLNSKFLRKEAYYKLTQTALITLLGDKQMQIRQLIGKYIQNYKVRCENEDHGDVKMANFLKFLFQLCTLEIGTVFYDGPSEENYAHLEVFRNFGIVSVKIDRKKNKKKVYVTPLIKCLFEEMGSMFENQENYKFLIVETNFKIYAYTKNEFELKILDFLFEIEYSFPGFVVGHITRNSIRKVLKRGVSSQRILQYMSMHAHPQTEARTVIHGVQYNIPANVANQIVIYEEEKNAITFENVLYLYEFADDNQFDRYLDKIIQANIPIMWKSKEKSIIVVQKIYEAVIRNLKE